MKMEELNWNRNPMGKWHRTNEVSRYWIPLMLLFVAMMATPVCQLSGQQSGPKVNVLLTPDYLEIGQTGSLTVTFEDLRAWDANAIRFPSFEGFRLHTPTLTSERVNNRETTHFIYQVTPMKPGDWEIPSFTFNINNQKLVSNAIKFKIYPAGKSPVGKLPDNKIAFLKIISPKDVVYVGESVAININLYYHESCSDPSWPDIEAAGFNLEHKQLGKEYRRRINNRMFRVTETTRIVTPMKTGKLTLGPASSTIHVPIQSIQRMSIYVVPREKKDIFGDPIEIECIPLPEEGRPDGFNGIVGSDYILTYSSSADSISVGDPITVRIKVAGKGNISGVQLPDDFIWDGFKTYEPKSDTIMANKVTMEGRKNFEMVVIPQSDTIDSLPDLNLSYFDPNRKSYVTISKPGPSLSVSPGTYNPTSIANAGPLPLEQQDPSREDENALAHIEYSLTSVPVVTGTASISPALLAAPGIGLLFFLGAHSFQLFKKVSERRQLSSSNSTKNKKLRESRITELEEFAFTNQNRSFFMTLFRLLQEDLGAAANIPAASITSEILDSHSSLESLDRETKESVRKLFHLCDLTIYGDQPDNVTLQQVYNDYLSLSQKLN